MSCVPSCPVSSVCPCPVCPVSSVQYLVPSFRCLVSGVQCGNHTLVCVRTGIFLVMTTTLFTPFQLFFTSEARNSPGIALAGTSGRMCRVVLSSPRGLLANFVGNGDGQDSCLTGISLVGPSPCSAGLNVNTGNRTISSFFLLALPVNYQFSVFAQFPVCCPVDFLS